VAGYEKLVVFNQLQNPSKGFTHDEIFTSVREAAQNITMMNNTKQSPIAPAQSGNDTDH
jgi:hypothetical protein